MTTPKENLTPLMLGVLLHPRCAPLSIVVPTHLANLQALIGGFIERVRCPFDPTVDLWINEQGRLFNLPPSLHVGPDLVLVGPVFALAHRGENSTSLTADQAGRIMQWMECQRVKG